MAQRPDPTRRAFLRWAVLAPLIAACAAPIAPPSAGPAKPAQLPTLIEFYADT